jgi:capsular exopolysaccharide synthesis family protein
LVPRQADPPRYAFPVPQAEVHVSNLAELRLIVARHKLLAILVFALIAALGVTYTFARKTRYEGKSVVLVDARPMQVINLEPVLSSPAPSPFSFQSEMESEIQLIFSQRVLRPVVNRFGIAMDPEFADALAFKETKAGQLLLLAGDKIGAAVQWAESLLGTHSSTSKAREAATMESDSNAYTNFLSRLNAKTRGRSRAIEISFVSEDPDKALAIANAVADSYMQSTLDEKREASSRALQTLKSGLEQLREKLLASEHAVEDYRQQADLVNVKGGDVISQRITELARQLSEAEGATRAAQANLERNRTAPGGPESAPAVLNSYTIQRLKEQEAKLRAEAADAAVTYGQTHPRLARVDAAAEDTRRKTDAETQRIMRSLEADVRGAKIREASLRQLTTELERQAAEQGKAEVRLRELIRETDANRTVYEAFLKRVQEVSQETGMQQPYVKIISAAETPVKAGPSRSLLTFGTMMLASVASVIAIIVAQLLTHGYQNLMHIQQGTFHPTLSIVPKVPRLRSYRHAPANYAISNPESSYAEAIHTLRVSLLTTGETPYRILMFTSSIAGEGKTATALSFARLSARATHRVLLVDCDLRRPRLHRLLGGRKLGLSDILEGHCDIDDAVQSDQRSGLDFISAGSRHASPIDLLQGEAMSQCMRSMSDRYDMIVLDAPPVLPVADARLLAPKVDGTIYVVRWESTSRGAVRMGLDTLEQSGARIAGVVFSGVDKNAIRALYNAKYVYRDA